MIREAPVRPSELSNENGPSRHKMVTIVPGYAPGYYQEYYEYEEEPLEECAPGELPLLAAEYKNVAGKDPDIKENYHRGGKQGEIEYVPCRGDDGRQNYNN